jgi:hypothetical protein
LPCLTEGAGLSFAKEAVEDFFDHYRIAVWVSFSTGGKDSCKTTRAKQ